MDIKINIKNHIHPQGPKSYLLNPSARAGYDTRSVF